MDKWRVAARSNYVRFSDLDGLKRALEPFEIEIAPGKRNNEGKICLLGCCEDGDFPGWTCRADGTELEFSFEEYVVPYLAEGETMVTIQVGTNSSRYDSGYAAAFQKNKAPVFLALSDIYELAAREFGVHKDSIIKAEN